jgi:hypothetical protein
MHHNNFLQDTVFSMYEMFPEDSYIGVFWKHPNNQFFHSVLTKLQIDSLKNRGYFGFRVNLDDSLKTSLRTFFKSNVFDGNLTNTINYRGALVYIINKSLDTKSFVLLSTLKLDTYAIQLLSMTTGFNPGNVVKKASIDEVFRQASLFKKPRTLRTKKTFVKPLSESSSEDIDYDRAFIDHRADYCKKIKLDKIKLKNILENTKRGVNPSYVDEYVRVAPSKLAKGESGLFANKDYDAKEPIIAYYGKVKKDSNSSSSSSYNPYTFVVKKKSGNLIIDGKDLKYASAARYANVARYMDEFNACFVQHEDDIILVAYRPIKKGEELLTSYGSGTYEVVPSLHRPVGDKDEKGVLTAFKKILDDKKLKNGKRRFKMLWENEAISWISEENIPSFYINKYDMAKKR